jgi:hypothetical protein
MTLVLVVGAVFLMAMAGGRLSGKSDPQELLNQAFSSEGAPKSGRIDASFSASLTGAPGQLASPVSFKLVGAFTDGAGAQLPKADLDMTIKAMGQNAQLGFISTGKRMFVGLQGNHYLVPERELNRLSGDRGSGADRQPLALLRPLGVDPGAWVKNERELGTETVRGVETTHVSADVDVRRTLDDMMKLAANAPNLAGVRGQELPAEAVEQVEDAVKQAKLDVFVGKDDKLLRRAAFQVEIDAKSPVGGNPVAGKLNLVLDLSDLNEPQTVRAPKEARPFSDLPSALSGLGLGSGFAPGLTGRGEESSVEPRPSVPDGPSGSQEARSRKHPRSGRRRIRTSAAWKRRGAAASFRAARRCSSDNPEEERRRLGSEPGSGLRGATSKFRVRPAARRARRRSCARRAPRSARGPRP